MVVSRFLFLLSLFLCSLCISRLACIHFFLFCFRSSRYSSSTVQCFSHIFMPILVINEMLNKQKWMFTENQSEFVLFVLLFYKLNYRLKSLNWKNSIALRTINSLNALEKAKLISSFLINSVVTTSTCSMSTCIWKMLFRYEWNRQFFLKMQTNKYPQWTFRYRYWVKITRVFMHLWSKFLKMLVVTEAFLRWVTWGTV